MSGVAAGASAVGGVWGSWAFSHHRLSFCKVTRALGRAEARPAVFSSVVAALPAVLFQSALARRSSVGSPGLSATLAVSAGLSFVGGAIAICGLPGRAVGLLRARPPPFPPPPPPRWCKRHPALIGPTATSPAQGHGTARRRHLVESAEIHMDACSVGTRTNHRSVWPSTIPTWQERAWRYSIPTSRAIGDDLELRDAVRAAWRACLSKKDLWRTEGLAI